METNENPIRKHVFDGIQEYDKPMPNWWLWTLWGTILFSFAYWIIGHFYGLTADPGGDIDRRIAKAKAIAAEKAGVVTNESLWAMSRDAAVVTAGEQVYNTNCAACHRPDMLGQIGPNLVDTAWIHGGQPLDVLKIIVDGYIAKGMPPWGNILGAQKSREVTAFILSKHKEGEPTTQAPPWVPGSTPTPATP